MVALASLHEFFFDSNENQMEPLISWLHYASSQVGGALVQANISDQKKVSKKIVCTCNLKYVIHLSFFSSGSNFSIVFTIFFFFFIRK